MKKIIFISILSICLFNSAIAQNKADVDTPTLKNSGQIIDLENTAINYSKSDRDALKYGSKLEVMDALFGQIPGLNISQGKGVSFTQNPSFTLHGFKPLVLIDGIPRDVNDLIIDEVEDVIVYKDAAATAIYGVRGAHGVINIITKKGRNQKKLEIGTSYQYGMAPKFRAPEFADSYTYARSLNTALAADGIDQRYSALELDAFKNNTYPEAYPNIDWYNESLSDFEVNHQFTFDVRGGKKTFDYYALIAYSRNQGLFEHHNEDDRYDNQLLDTRLTMRTNIRVDVTKTTEVKVNLQTRMKEFNSPNSYDKIIDNIYRTPSGAFPIKSDGIWGGDVNFGNINPIAALSSNGHYKKMANTLNLDVSLAQDLQMITDGLSATVLYAIDNNGVLNEQSELNYQYIDLNPTILPDGTLVTDPIIYGDNSKTLSHDSGIKKTYFNSYVDAILSYKKSFGKSKVNANFIYNMQSNEVTGQNQSRKRQSMTGSLAYSYNKKYFIDLVASYAGASAVQLGDRFDTYPAVSAGWVISEENFFKPGAISYLRVNGSFGYSGWDASTPYDLEKLYYKSGKKGFATLGKKGNILGKGGWSESDLPTNNLRIEKMRRITFGADLNMFRSRMSISADAFYNKRYNVLLESTNTTSSVLGLPVRKQNDGIYNYRGVDLALNWKDNLGHFSYEFGGTLSFTESEIVENNEGFKPYDYLSRKGNSINQAYGLEMDGYFANQEDINNSPVHTFYPVSPGDIKYKDQNRDNVIDQDDIVKMFTPTVPELYYGFHINLKYKNLSVYANFQGVGNHTVSLLNSSLYKPLVNNSNISNTFLQNEIYWTEENSDKATMPRLTTVQNSNNYRNSSQWYRNASYLKLRDLRVGYTFNNPTGFLSSIETYVSANNLFSIDNIDFADPENIKDNYPSLRYFWAGLNIKF
ncbi:SusC/RagA family TonB-linked outer membrane protein [Prolixibacteraceae bacterium]|nr:SusC/RagA family TonB-linked outer membrane protein [Prolixibacteraceae bacterium]